jgi:hypothetical protein
MAASAAEGNLCAAQEFSATCKAGIDFARAYEAAGKPRPFETTSQGNIKLEFRAGFEIESPTPR